MMQRKISSLFLVHYLGLSEERAASALYGSWNFVATSLRVIIGQGHGDAQRVPAWPARRYPAVMESGGDPGVRKLPAQRADQSPEISLSTPESTARADLGLAAGSRFKVSAKRAARRAGVSARYSRMAGAPRSCLANRVA